MALPGHQHHRRHFHDVSFPLKLKNLHSAIEKITAVHRTVMVRDENMELIPKRVAVWNPTVANLTLMALGSSAPEILLSVIETVTTLGSVPGELGPSTIVGSAAFNLLVISAVSIYAVSPESDKRSEAELEEDECVRGTKKIRDLGVFTITCVWSMIAYIWLYYCLMDSVVSEVEAWLTFVYFWIMLIMAFIADKINAKRTKERLDKAFGSETNIGDEKEASRTISSEKMHPAEKYSAIETYNHLLLNEMGKKEFKTEEDIKKGEEMRDFLKIHFGTDKI